jgi:hypothetical protein
MHMMYRALLMMIMVVPKERLWLAEPTCKSSPSVRAVAWIALFKKFSFPCNARKDGGVARGE